MVVLPLEVNEVTFDQSTELPPEELGLLLPHAAANAAVLAATKKVAIALLLRNLPLRPVGSRGSGREHRCGKR
jgi:hypothetical protein